jgi:hypothetical protein
MAEKTIKILIEVPENWIDVDSPTLWAGRAVYNMARDLVKDAIIEQYLNKITPPDFTFTDKELKDGIKDKITTILAERAIKKNDL